MIISSFFPGRVRLRAEIFKDSEIFSRAEGILKKSFGEHIKKFEYNNVTGSILLCYDSSKIPVDKLSKHLSFLKKLNYQAEHFSKENRQTIFSMLDELEELLK